MAARGRFLFRRGQQLQARAVHLGDLGEVRLDVDAVRQRLDECRAHFGDAVNRQLPLDVDPSRSADPCTIRRHV